VLDLPPASDPSTRGVILLVLHGSLSQDPFYEAALSSISLKVQMLLQKKSSASCNRNLS
jgi:hypothetical protein